MFIGHTRFSLFSPRSGAWVASRGAKFKSAEEYREYLYSDERLGLRCEVFSQVTLPMLAAAAKGHDVTHVVSYSETLPPKSEQILLEAAARYEFLVLDKVPENKWPLKIERLAKSLLEAEGSGRRPDQVFGVYRLDDDDVLSADYFEQVSPHLVSEKVGHVVSLGRGITALYSDGTFHNVREVTRPMLAIGLLNVCQFDPSGVIREPVPSPHTQAALHNPVVLDNRRLSYIWTRHLTQDTTLLYNKRDVEEQLARTLSDMDANPELKDIAQAQSAFPLVADRMTSTSVLG